MLRNSLIYIVFLFMAIGRLYALDQVPRSFSFELLGAYNIHNISADFVRLPGIPNCCKKFTSGNGSGIMLGIGMQKYFSDKFGFRMRAYFRQSSINLTSPEQTTVFDGTQSAPGEFLHILDVDMLLIGVEPLLTYRVLGALDLNLGFSAAYTMSSDFNQKEQISKPSNRATFLDENGLDSRMRTRFEYSGELPEKNDLLYAVSGGLSYELPLNREKTLTLIPEAMFSYALNPLVRSLNFNMNSLSLGLSIRYRPTKYLVPEPDYFELPPEFDMLAESTLQHDFSEDSSFIAKKDCNCGPDDNYFTFSEVNNLDVEAIVFTDSSKTTASEKLPVEEFTATRTFPMLNYVFFAENSAEIPARYNLLSHSQSSSFSENDLYNKETLEIYYELLNIIGKRLQENPAATLTLEGIKSSLGEEAKNPDIAVERANSIKDYLADIWGIPDNRLRIKEKDLRYQSRKITEDEKIEELRRVEINSADWEIIKPIFINDTVTKMRAEYIRFIPHNPDSIETAEWNIVLTQDSDTLMNSRGNGALPEYLDWEINYRLMKNLHGISNLRYILSVKQNDGNIVSSPRKLLDTEYKTINQKAVEKTNMVIDRYSLMLFDLNKSDINERNKKIVNFIKDRIKSNSEVYITGYTDEIGETDYNLRLSKARANATARALKVSPSDSKGVGSEFLLYDNNLPEGRFYCRTVEVVIETPLTD